MLPLSHPTIRIYLPTFLPTYLSTYLSTFHVCIHIYIQDQILDPALYAERFLDDLGGEAKLRYIENCGHVCHLEKPLQAVEEIIAFVNGREGPLVVSK